MLHNKVVLALLLVSFCLQGCFQRSPGKAKAIAFPVKHVPLNNFFGVNAFEWDFEDPANAIALDSIRLSLVKNFTGIRHYMDWEKIEPKEGHYTFCPVRSGGWNYDTIYTWCKAQHIEVLACIKAVPGWLLNSYPQNERDNENVPARYGKSLNDPNSYIEQAKAAFQYAARYGYNKNVDPGLVHVDATPRWTADRINRPLIGLGLISYIECDNERDKWWKGDKAHQTGRQYAANLSAFYDGNKGKMGPGVGVKNADPAMIVVMSGLAKADTNYVKDMIAWCRENRGLKPDGSVDMPWDIINYHYYSNDGDGTGNHQTTGVAPEISDAEALADGFVAMAHRYAHDMPVWITEAGYDINQESVQKAIRIGDKSELITQADWILRTSLLYSRAGIQKVFYYELDDDNAQSGTRYATSGFVSPYKTPRASAKYLHQTSRLFGGYTYINSLNNDPVIDRYMSGNNTMYVLLIPDQKGRVANYQLPISGDTAYIYKPDRTNVSMSLEKKKIINGKVDIRVTETPSFVTSTYIDPAGGKLRQ